MKRRRLFLQRQHRLATEHQTGAVSSYDGTSYCTEGYSENAFDHYHDEVPAWVNDTAGSHWQHSGYICTIALLPVYDTVWHTGLRGKLSNCLPF